MKTIWKYQISPGGSSCFMPRGAKILDVQIQRGEVCIWALVDHDEGNETRHFSVFGTGHEILIADLRNYIGTFQMEGGALVFHLFEDLKP